MPKLIKINNQNQVTGVINAQFQESFIVPAMGKISLLNMSCELEEKNILISQDNSTFERSVSNNQYRNVVITQGLYDLQGFIRELSRALNASLRNVAGAEQGLQFKVSLADRTFIRISFNRTANTSTSCWLTDRTKWMAGIVASASNGFQKNTADGWTSATISDRFFTGGSGAFTCVRDNVNDNPVIIGLVNSVAEESYNNVFDVNAYAYCLYSAPRSAGGAVHVYWCRHTESDGTVTDVETEVEAGNHMIGLMLSEGKLIYVRGDAGSVPVSNDTTVERLLEIDWNYDKYYGMISIYNDGTSITNANFWPDPYFQITSSFIHYHDEAPPYNMMTDDIINIDPTIGGSVHSVINLRMPPSVRTLLGFQTNQRSADVKSASFTGTRPYANVILPQNMKVVLDGMTIESYDNIVKQHQSILMTVPTLVADDGKFIYDSQFLLNVELSNKYPLNISEMRLRLLDFGNNLIKIKPNATDITLILS